jgi:hypothetical protein
MINCAKFVVGFALVALLAELIYLMNQGIDIAPMILVKSNWKSQNSEYLQFVQSKKISNHTKFSVPKCARVEFPKDLIIDSQLEIRELSDIVIYQFGDLKCIDQHRLWIKSVQEYALERGYSYILEKVDPFLALEWINNARRLCIPNIVDNSTKIQGLKPYAIQNAIQMLEHRGIGKKWLVYLDLDVYISNAEMKIEEIISLSSYTTILPPFRWNPASKLSKFIDNSSISALKSKRNCFIIAQDHSITINSGFLAFSLDDLSKLYEFFELWETIWFSTAGIWDGDQISFAYTVLWNVQELLKIHPSDRDSLYDCEFSDAHGANICWNRFMKRLDLLPKNRYFSEYCLLPLLQRGHPFRINAHTGYFPGDFLYHGHTWRF